MASPASTNEPSTEHVQAAVAAIEKVDAELLSEKMAYMSRCKGLRKQKAGQYDHAADQGISRKLLKKKIKERSLQRKIDANIAELEDDERSEYQMLSEKLGEFADTPLGAAALAKADGGPGSQPAAH